MKEDKGVSVEGVLSFEEFKTYNHYHTKKLRRGFFIATLILFTLMIFNVIDAIWFTQLFWALVFSLIPAGFIVGVMNLGVHRRSSKLYHSDPKLKKTMTYAFREDGIHLTTEKSYNYFEWSDLVSVYEYEEMFVLYVSKTKAIVLPKRFFETEKQQERFNQFVHERITISKA
ncbi:YcxB family protein [Halobacillus locisalis]|uniref:YcxB family protein n=1 Tax=Halobacillus locisalis TaxID=220753 RepID=A0A838CVM7_9BACI|nr:YcxB family protein [Halobacillus locisalis]MBA2175984.1 YcxB family protein [Halobacillus locisalis]